MGIEISSYNNLSSAFRTEASQNMAASRVNGENTISGGAATTAAKTDDSFSNLMDKALSAVDAASQESLEEQTSLLTGQSQNIHSIAIAAEKADIALKMTLQVRNKALDAYQEIMRMQI